MLLTIISGATLLLSATGDMIKDMVQSDYDALPDGTPVILDAWAEWCPHSQDLKPKFYKLMDFYKDTRGVMVASVRSEYSNRSDASGMPLRNYLKQKLGSTRRRRWGWPAAIYVKKGQEGDFAGDTDANRVPKGSYDEMANFAIAHLGGPMSYFTDILRAKKGCAQQDGVSTKSVATWKEAGMWAQSNCKSGVFMYATWPTSWGTRCCSSKDDPGGESNDHWDVGRVVATKVIHAAHGCKGGTKMDVYADLKDAAWQAVLNCPSKVIMWSQTYGGSWPTYCCESTSDVGDTNDYWDIYSVLPPGSSSTQVQEKLMQHVVNAEIDDECEDTRIPIAASANQTIASSVVTV